MNYYNIVFSPTGGTQKVAGILAGNLTEQAAIIDLCDRNTDFGHFSFTQDDICLVAVPSYGGRVPSIAIQRLSQLKGNGAKAVLIVVYGNREYEDTLIELKDTLELQVLSASPPFPLLQNTLLHGSLLQAVQISRISTNWAPLPKLSMVDWKQVFILLWKFPVTALIKNSKGSPYIPLLTKTV